MRNECGPFLHVFLLLGLVSLLLAVAGEPARHTLHHLQSRMRQSVEDRLQDCTQTTCRRLVLLRRALAAESGDLPVPTLPSSSLPARADSRHDRAAIAVVALDR